MDAFLQIVFSEKVISSVITVAVAYCAWILVRKIIGRFSQKSASGDGIYGRRASFLRTLQAILKYIILTIAALSVMQSFGVNISSFIASFGIASAIVGLALQDMLKDIIMGVHIMTDHFYSVGDTVRYNGVEGVVISFNIRTTKLRVLSDGSIMTLCNRNVDEIAILSGFFDIDLPLSYDEDVRKVHETLEGITEKLKDIPGIDNAEYKGTQSFEDSAIIYKIRFYCRPENKWDMWRACIKQIQEGLNEAHITIPYNQLDIHQI